MSVLEEGPVSLADAPVRRLNMIEAINDALSVMMERDPNVVVFGEDVGYFGGVFRATAGLQKTYGKTRVFDTPITECGIVGVATTRLRGEPPALPCKIGLWISGDAPPIRALLASRATVWVTRTDLRVVVASHTSQARASPLHHVLQPIEYSVRDDHQARLS